MNSSREILRSVALLVTSLVAMLTAIVLLGLHGERSIGEEPGRFPASTPWNERPLRSVLLLTCRVGS
jgi:hypothetical protein